MRSNKTFSFKSIFLIFPLVLSSLSLSAQTASETTILLPNEILQISDNPALDTSILIADKSDRKLYFFKSSNNLSTPETFEIDIGKNDGNKTKRNDKKTPEGIYLLLQKKTQPEIPYDQYGSIAFTTNYPNVFDKFENKTGDGIWLHSVPDSIPLSRGSKGCVVVRNDTIKNLSSQIDLNKSFIVITSKINWQNAESHELQKNKINSWLSTWKNTWQNQDLENYIKLYSDNFSAPQFNKKTWLKHKENLKKSYQNITIDMSSPSILHTQNQYLVRFIQNYTSDKHHDTGIKTLYLVEDNGHLQILREEWTSL